MSEKRDIKKVGRYLVFAYYKHYPNGGWGDFICAFDSEIEAYHYAYEISMLENAPYEYSHVIDLTQGKIIHKYPS